MNIAKVVLYCLVVFGILSVVLGLIGALLEALSGLTEDDLVSILAVGLLLTAAFVVLALVRRAVRGVPSAWLAIAAVVVSVGLYELDETFTARGLAITHLVLTVVSLLVAVGAADRALRSDGGAEPAPSGRSPADNGVAPPPAGKPR